MCPQDILHHEVIIRCSPVVNSNSQNLSLENHLWRHSPSCFPFRWNCPRFELNFLSGRGVTTPHQVVKGMLCGLIVSKSKFLFSSRAHLQFHTATISREHQHQVCVGILLWVSYESQFSGKEKCVGGASLFAYGRNFGKKVSSSTCQRWLKHLDLIHWNMQSS